MTTPEEVLSIDHLPEFNWIVTEDKLKKGSICRLKTFQANSVKDKP